MNLRGLDTAFLFGFIAVVVVIVALWVMSCAMPLPPEPPITETITDAARER